MEIKGVLLDTSFCIRLLNENDPLHSNALGYYRYFVENEYPLRLSTISIAEYCVRGKLDELPLRNIAVLPFNVDHAVKAGEFANVVFANKELLDLPNRLIIPNDNKLFAQAQTEFEISHFATSDAESLKVYGLLKQNMRIDFDVLNIREPFSTVLGVLPFD